MRKIFLLAYLWAALACLSFAQGAPGPSNYPYAGLFQNGAPSGTCAGLNVLDINTANGALYTCPTPGGSWTPVAGSGSFTAGGDLTGTSSAQNVAGMHFGSTAFTLSTTTPPSVSLNCFGYINTTTLGGINCSGFTAAGNLSGSGSSQNVIGMLFGASNFTLSTGTPPSSGVPCLGFISSGTLGGITCGGAPGSPSLSLQGNNGGSLFAIPGAAFNATNGITELQIYGPTPWCDVTNSNYGASFSVALVAAATACSGGTVLIPAGSYTSTAQIAIPNAVTIQSVGGTATITKSYNSASTGWIAINANNVTMRGLALNCGSNSSDAGKCIEAGTSTGFILDHNTVTGCYLACVGGSNVSTVGITYNTLTSGSAANAATIDFTTTSQLTNLSIKNNVIDGSGITTDTLDGNGASISVKGGADVVAIDSNLIVNSSKTYGMEIGNFGGSGMFHTSVTNNILNQRTAPASNGGACGSVSGGLGTVISNNVCDANGFTFALAGWELGGATGSVITGNTINLDQSGTSDGILVDAVASGFTISGNTINGFGGSNGVGIALYTTYASNSISACTTAGQVATCTTTAAIDAQVQTNTTVYVTVGSFVDYVLVTAFNRTANTFSFNFVGSGPPATTTGTVQMPNSNNVIANNNITFPVAATRTGNLFGLQMRDGATNVLSNNKFVNNTINGTGNSAEYCISLQPASGNTMDSNTFQDNVCQNTTNGINRSSANHTNSDFRFNRMIGVTTQFVGTVGTGETQENANWQDFIGQAAAPADPQTGNCRLYFNTSTGLMAGINSSGGSCSPSGGGGSGTVGSGTIDGLAYYTGATTVGSITPPTSNGNYLLNYNVTAGAAVVPTATLPGVATNPQTGTSYTYLYSDRAGYVSFSNASAIAATLPQAGSTGFTSNWVNVSCDIGAGTVTITPSLSTISYTTGSAYTSAASTLALTIGQCAWIYSDGTNYFAIVRGGGGGVTSVSGDGTVTNNSSSTGAVTISLANAAQNSVLAGPATGGAGTPTYQTAPTISAANMTGFPTFNQSTTGTAANVGTATYGANKWWGNNTGSTAAPAASSIGTSDVSVNEYAGDTGAANAYVVTLSPPMLAYSTGVEGCFLAANNNTGASTVNFNGLGAKTISKFNGAAVTGNDIVTTHLACMRYNGTTFDLLNGGGITGTGAVTLNGSPSFINKVSLTNTWESLTAPTIASGFGATSPSITNANGTAAFSINVGTGTITNPGVLTMPAAAHNWVVNCTDITTVSTTNFVTQCKGTSTTSVTCTSYTDVATVGAGWTASDVLQCQAAGQ